MKLQFRLFGAVALASLLPILYGQSVQAQFTAVFTDSYEVSTDSFNVNLENATRQSGSTAPLDYLTNTPDPTDAFQHQVFSAATAPGQPLQLGASGQLTAPAPVFAFPVMVSPDFNFKGSTDDGILGRRITFDLDVAAVADESAGFGRFVNTGITIGSSIPLVDKENTREIIGEPATPYLSISFIEDTFNTGDPNDPDTSFIQVFDSTDLVVVRANHEQGVGTLNVQLDITDPSDGDPWDGVGSTAVEVFVNGNSIVSYEKTDGGYSDNFITLWGDRNFAGNTLATNLFDNFTVFAASAAPSQLLGDYDDSDLVSQGDLDIVLLNWGEAAFPGNEANIPPGGGTFDGLVSQNELDGVLLNWGNTPPLAAGAVPEPSSLGLAACALAGLLQTRRRW